LENSRWVGIGSQSKFILNDKGTSVGTKVELDINGMCQELTTLLMKVEPKPFSQRTGYI